MAIEVLNNARIATLDSPGYGLIEAGALVHDHARILWVGPEQDLPAEHALAPRRDMGGRLVTPALIDCHTHIIVAGDRAQAMKTSPARAAGSCQPSPPPAPPPRKR
jgi:imidazolonepropionase